jgi:GntR family transcriptional regulator / MocR family aminotransferase
MVTRMSGGPEILLHIDRSHPDTLAGQLRAGLRDAIRSGRLPAGTRLPASRVLADDLGTSRGVVVEAYAQLVAEGFLVTRPGSGTLVSDAAGVTSAHSSWWHRRGQQHHRLWRPDVDLRPSGPDPGLFPRSEAARTMTEIFRRLPTAELGYTGPWGVAALRGQLESHLGRRRSAMAPADGIIVVTGRTQALSVIARTLAAAGHDHVAVEDPGNPRHRHLLQVHGLKVIPVPVDDNGLDVGGLAGSGCRVVLTSPSCQFPTGAVMSAERRSRLLDWAVARRALIIEDDQRADFHYERPALACLQGMRPEHVILIGSVSMTLAPAMRLGWIVPPPQLLRAVAEGKRDDDFGTPVLEQHALASWLESGRYDRHVRHARRGYAMRRAALSRELHEHFPRWRLCGIPAGLEMLLELPAGISDRHVAAHAMEQGLGITPLSPMRISMPGPPGLVLSYARLAPQRCADAVGRLELTVGAVMAEKPSLSATAIPADEHEWHLTSADWPAAPDDFYL